MSDVAGARAPSAGRREWIGLAVLVLPTLLVAMDMTSLFLALPRLSADLGANGTEQLWISDAYGFMVAGFVITMGTLGDRIGRRRLLLLGGAAFAVLSVAAAYASTPEMMIVARGLLGVAGATLMPSTLALISNMFRRDGQRAKAISVWATCQFAGGALGPVLAGVLLQHFWWGSVFLIAVPAMVVLLLAGPVLLPEYRNPAPGRMDPVSVALSLGAVLAVVYGLKQLAVEGAHDLALPLAAIVVGTAVGVVFVRRQLTLDTPLLDLRLFGNRSFTAVLVALVLAGVAMAGTGLLVTQYLQSVLGHSPAGSALLFAPMGLGVAVGTMTAPALASRMRPTTAIAGGLAVSVLGCLLLTQVSSTGGLPLVIVGITVLALGTGPLFALGTGMVVGSVPPERAGSAASMSETSNYFGSSLGLALLGVTAASVYQHHMAHAGVPAARETLAGAVTAARNLPSDQAAELLHTAKDAFTSGLNLTGAIAAALFAALAVLTATTRRESAQAAVELPETQVELEGASS
ncbi:MFS transporter [Actinoallomurus iriomotensis]|uniref:MFS transporter n=1 Tax=Actinoallomurus iriomotensis TaxID=478107 RepID=A0A9W6VZ11_9ACTN|nr:MFS transporter [Actinoallomurus iriomotensis]GLY84247.1 MFS transporter [Actinoallomurus iriomotensis]